ncbi:MAG: hypothetical protein ICV66_02055, partial [Chitinophagaceae bacterium]|nr:hypothetical protein [Chitinophagaceae bacterium]
MSTEHARNEFKAALAFGFGDDVTIEPLGSGLINKTFLVRGKGQQPIVLQRFNTYVFPHPEDIQHNYITVEKHLKKKGFFIPPLISTVHGELLWKDEDDRLWRAIEFVLDTFTRDVVGIPEEAYAVA